MNTVSETTSLCAFLLGGMNRGMGMPQQQANMMGDWGMARPGASPIGPPGHPSMGHNPKGMMGGPMVNRSNSVPAPRSILQKQLMEMGKD